MTVLKTAALWACRFESYILRSILYGEMAELAEGARLLSVYGLTAHPGFESLSLRHSPGFI